jgi:hypothetical protein
MKKRVDRDEQRKLFKAWKNYLKDSKLTDSEITKRAKTFSRKQMKVKDDA